MSAPLSQGVPSDRGRFLSIDIVRGAVMVLMALDHVRVFAGVPAGGPTFGLFFTRWITHFCAPAFVLLAGTGAFLHGRNLGDRVALARYLVTRGALLVLLELTISRFSWTFNFDYAHYTEANVIWAIGWSMILLAALLPLGPRIIGGIGVAIIALHNLLDPVLQRSYDGDGAAAHWLWRVMYVGGDVHVTPEGPLLVVLYAIVPWVGVLAAGYAFGQVMLLDTPRRHRLCRWIGLGAVGLFIVLRATQLYGDPWPWRGHSPETPALLRFLWTNKYPASLLFLLMTLGPAIALLPWLESGRGRVTEWLATFGRVPLFYYLLHIPFIHAVAVLISLVRTPDATGWLFLNHPLRIPPAPAGYVWSLPMLWGVAVLVVIALYYPCRWYADLRARRPGGWRSYL
jgi:uncharacterized membrane protein